MTNEKTCWQSIFLLLFANTQTSKITKLTFSKLRNCKKIHSQNMFQKCTCRDQLTYRRKREGKKKLLHLHHRTTLNVWNPHTTQRCTVKATRKARSDRKWPSETLPQKPLWGVALWCFIWDVTFSVQWHHNYNELETKKVNVAYPDKVIHLFLPSLIQPVVLFPV